MDYYLKTYQNLITALEAAENTFQTFQDFLKNPTCRAVILRHDVDKLPSNALKMAQLEHDLGIAASYYFRVVPESWNKAVIAQITDLGHEIGYHYEDLALAEGDHEKAIRHFEARLAQFRNIYPVTTICMHGNPLSRHDNRDLWKHYDYRDFGIIGEPYFDVDFNKVFYITDTGRSWNDAGASVRDNVHSGFDIRIKNTFALIALAEEGSLPDRMMINVHPQRWHDTFLPWAKELVWQNIKNVIKKRMIKARR